jgi:hypothetical protein
MRIFLKRFGGCFLLAGIMGLGTGIAPLPLQSQAIAETHLEMSAVHIAEPFDDGMLDKMERLLQSDLPPKQKTQLAAILYRYRRSSGEAYLDKALTQKRDDAAAVFALNRDEARLDRVLKAFTHLKPTWEDGSYSLSAAQLPLALGKWDHPRVVAALLDKQKKHPNNGDVALALARRNVKAAVPLLTRACARAEWDSQETTKLKAALANLTPEIPRRFTELMQRSQTPQLQAMGFPPQFIHHRVLEHLAYTQDLRLIRVLIQEIENFRPPPKMRDEWLTPISPAVEQLVEYPAAVRVPTLRKLFDQLKPSAKTVRHQIVSEWRVAGYLYNALPHGDRAFLKEALGEEAVAELELLQGLRPIPQNQLVFESELAERF